MKNAPNHPDREEEKEEEKIPPAEDIYSMFRPEHEQHSENIFRKPPEEEDHIHALQKDTELSPSEKYHPQSDRADLTKK